MATSTQGPAVNAKTALELYRTMFLIRRFEEKCAEMYGRTKIGGFLHLYIGEEAVAAGVFDQLRPEDKIVTHYREHGHALARGLDPKKVMAELFGRSGGTSKGKGGSMHIFDAEKGFLGGYAIVGGMMPIAVGLGYAANYLNEKRVILCIFGDGAVNEGAFHESLNLAALWKLPVVFLLENNGYGMGTRVERVHAGLEMAHLADAFTIPSEVVDGMDVLAVREAAARAIVHARSGAGPFFLEALCYRFRGHSMADPVNYRKKEEEEAWRKRDPILTMRQTLIQKRWANEESLLQLETKVDAEVDAAAAYAEASAPPALAELYTDVYADA